MRRRGVLLALAVLLLAGVSYSATDPDPVIRRGIDTFTTTSDGTTFYDFAKTPIPAGFFCKRSAPFTGRVEFRGLPLETGKRGELRNADTVIERLDDAAFDENGVAVTRIQFKALSMASIAPIKTACGAYHVYVTLSGPQRVTTMKIYRTEADGGHFVAPLAVNARLTFIPAKAPKGKNPRKLELTNNFTFPATPIPWSLTAGAETKRVGSAIVDTNGDLTPDTRLSATSNFWPGWEPGQATSTAKCPYCCVQCEPPSCHIDPYTGKEHCTGGRQACGYELCP
jgi:hypothetical protein